MEKHGKLTMRAGGFLSGLLNGLLGTGGGVMAVPSLRAAGYEEKPALASASAAIWVMCLTSVIYALCAGQKIHWEEVGLISVGGVPGGVLGALLLSRLKSKYLRYAFNALLVYSGVRLLCG